MLFQGQFLRALQHFEQTIRLYDPSAHGSLAYAAGIDRGANARAFAAGCHWYLGYPDRALAVSEEAVALAKRVEHPVRLLSSNSLFARCTEEELAQLAATAYPMSFEPGDLLCTEGGESPECYIIEEGYAVVTVGRKGAGTVGEHDVVGERGVLLDTTRAATVTATTHMITYAISRERLRALVAGNAVAREWMLPEMVRRYPNAR